VSVLGVRLEGAKMAWISSFHIPPSAQKKVRPRVRATSGSREAKYHSCHAEARDRRNRVGEGDGEALGISGPDVAAEAVEGRVEVVVGEMVVEGWR